MDSIAEKTVCMLYKLTIQHSFKNSQINSLNKHFNLNNQYKQSMKKIPILLSKTGTFIKQIPCQPWIKQYLSQGRWTHTINTDLARRALQILSQVFRIILYDLFGPEKCSPITCTHYILSLLTSVSFPFSVSGAPSTNVFTIASNPVS